MTVSRAIELPQLLESQVREGVAGNHQLEITDREGDVKARQEHTCKYEKITSWDHHFQPLDHRVRISCCYHDVMPQIKGDEPTSVIWLMGKNPPEQSRKLA